MLESGPCVIKIVLGQQLLRQGQKVRTVWESHWSVAADNTPSNHH